MEHTKTELQDWEDQKKENIKHLKLWVGLWCLSMMLAAFGPKYMWDYNMLLTVPAILLNLGIGFKMLVWNKRYLLGLDEFQRKIQLEAMAWSLGVGLVVGLNYELLEDVKLISFQPEIPHLVILMALTVFIGIIAGNRRYQ
ncbi:MAG: hypothetical protein K9N38_06855 [Candidatus Marinimicrobia bacterium]|nr:hypothetical protein [Candidatus Neomarinimicrobiota bacterium]